MKLTAKIAAAYLGADVKVNGYYNNDSTPKEIVGTMTHVGLMSIGTGGGQYSYSQCQLILTPLSKISDSDAVEVAKMCGASFAADDIGRAKAGKDLLFNYLYRTSNVRGADWFKVLDYLRSKSYDIDNLIAAGVAVEK